jgi:hypothetical protein
MADSKHPREIQNRARVIRGKTGIPFSLSPNAGFFPKTRLELSRCAADASRAQFLPSRRNPDILESSEGFCASDVL